jgi:hypothetical protein
MIVVSVATDEMRDLRDLTFANKRAYCQKHGYKFVEARQSLDPSRPPAWSKIVALGQLCKSFPQQWALWIDADAGFARMDFAAEELIDESVDFIITRDWNGINTASSSFACATGCGSSWTWFIPKHSL